MNNHSWIWFASDSSLFIFSGSRPPNLLRIIRLFAHACLGQDNATTKLEAEEETARKHGTKKGEAGSSGNAKGHTQEDTNLAIAEAQGLFSESWGHLAII